MKHRSDYEKKHVEVKGIIGMLGSKLSSMRYREKKSTAIIPKFSSMVEVCPNNICLGKAPCSCVEYSESDMHIEKIEELEDYILELKERIVNLEKEKQEANNSGVKMNKGSERTYNSHLKSLEDKVDGVVELFRHKSAILEDVGRKACDSVKALKRDLLSCKESMCLKDQELFAMRTFVESCKADLGRIPGLEDEIKKKLCAEKKLRNEILDLKGAIRVFCRIRPLLTDDEQACKLNSTLEMMKITGPTGSTTKDLSFRCDRIFGPFDNQECVFDEVAPLIHSGMDGYKICIFAYGQTGSGKTYTMEGEGASKGVIHRSINEIFGIAEKMRDEGWIFQFCANIVEVYNENIRSLLSESGNRIEIRYLGDEVVMNNCVDHYVSDKNSLIDLFEVAKKNRSIGATMSNEKSSRSHLVLTLKIKMENISIKETREGIFNFVDLAGSERLNFSKAEGERLKETQNINKSLSALGNVITAMARKEQHVPFRDSKLTFLLKEYLQGNARILMFINIAIEKKHYNETLCSLRFASKVSECKFGPIQCSIHRQVG